MNAELPMTRTRFEALQSAAQAAARSRPEQLKRGYATEGRDAIQRVRNRVSDVLAAPDDIDAWESLDTALRRAVDVFHDGGASHANNRFAEALSLVDDVLSRP
jgi:hypothetical protein